MHKLSGAKNSLFNYTNSTITLPPHLAQQYEGYSLLYKQSIMLSQFHFIDLTYVGQEYHCLDSKDSQS